MNSETRTIAVFSVLVVILATAALTLIPNVDAEETDQPHYDQNLGEMWSYTVQFVNTDSNAQSIIWDFGDGSPTVSANGDENVENWNPKHTYSEKGTYYVTQTCTNPEGKATMVFRVDVMGFPYVTLVYNNGEADGRIDQSLYGVPVESLENPTREGYDFTGWFTDEGCTVEYDGAPVNAPITLYAGWSENAGGDEDGSDTDWLSIALIVIGLIIILLSLLAWSAVGPVSIKGVIAGIIAVITGLLKFMGVF